MFILRDETGVKDTSHLATKVESEARFVNVTGDTLSGDLNMNSKKIINLPVPVEEHEAVNKTYADSLYKGPNLLRVIPFSRIYESFHGPVALTFFNIRVGVIRDNNQIRVFINRGLFHIRDSMKVSGNRVGELGQMCTFTVTVELINAPTDGRVYNIFGLIYVFERANDPNMFVSVKPIPIIFNRSATETQEATETQ